MKTISPLLFIAYFILYDQLTKFNEGLRGSFPLGAIFLTCALFMLFGFLLAFSFPMNLKAVNRNLLIVLAILFLLPALSPILNYIFVTYIFPIPWSDKFISFLMPYRTFGQIGIGYVIFALPALRRRRRYH